jgi:hypothetical protein
LPATAVVGGNNHRLRKEKTMLPEKQEKSFNDFYKAARSNKILDPKTTLMIHLATAMSVGCYP